MREWSLINRWTTFDKMDLVLDVGCGTGFFTGLTSDFNWGVDINEKDIEIAKRYHNGIFKVADATNLPFPDDSFHKIICICVLEHIQDDVKEIGRAHV